MREELGKMRDRRERFTGVLGRFGTKKGWQGSPELTVLLKKVRHRASGKTVTDHLWFNYTQGFEEADLKEGDCVEFDARVEEYEKGYRGSRAEESGEAWNARDWKLSKANENT